MVVQGDKDEHEYFSVSGAVFILINFEMGSKMHLNQLSGDLGCYLNNCDAQDIS